MPNSSSAVALVRLIFVATLAACTTTADEAATVPDTTESPPAAIVPQPAPGADDTVATAPAAVVPPAGRTEPTRPYVRDVPNVVVEQTPAQAATGASVLKRAAAAYADMRSLRATFALRRENPLLGSTTNSRGTLYQKRPDRFLMKFSDPEGDVIVSDGRYFWLYYPSADPKQVLRAPAGAAGAGGVDLQAQFLGDPLRRFTHTYHGIENVGDRRAHVVTMVPRENVGYRSLKVWIDAEDALVRRFILTENNGVVQEITLSNLTINPTLSNDLFAFTPPAGARVIENP